MKRYARLKGLLVGIPMLFAWIGILSWLAWNGGPRLLTEGWAAMGAFVLAPLGWMLLRAEDRAERLAREYVQEKHEAERRREEAIRQGGAPGQLSEADSPAPAGALSEVQRSGAQSAVRRTETSTR